MTFNGFEKFHIYHSFFASLQRQSVIILIKGDENYDKCRNRSSRASEQAFAPFALMQR